MNCPHCGTTTSTSTCHRCGKDTTTRKRPSFLAQANASFRAVHTDTPEHDDDNGH